MAGLNAGGFLFGLPPVGAAQIAEQPKLAHDHRLFFAGKFKALDTGLAQEYEIDLFSRR
mgnify:CR=1 FL=1